MYETHCHRLRDERIDSSTATHLFTRKDALSITQPPEEPANSTRLIGGMPRAMRMRTASGSRHSAPGHISEHASCPRGQLKECAPIAIGAILPPRLGKRELSPMPTYGRAVQVQ